MKFFVSVLFFTVIASAYGTPSSADFPGTAIVLRQKRQLDSTSLDGTRQLIQQLVENLRNATQQAMVSMETFSKGLQEQVTLFQEGITKEIAALRERIDNATKEFRQKFQNSGTAVLNCVEQQRAEADKLFNTTIANIITCATERIDYIASNIASLANGTSTALEQADTAVKDSRNCTQANSDILASAACLGSVALRIQYQGATYAIQSGLTISRISIAIATLRTTLASCASMRLFEASLGVAKITLDIGSCSATSILSILANGNKNQ